MFCNFPDLNGAQIAASLCALATVTAYALSVSGKASIRANADGT
jgi:hypothetical protein